MASNASTASARRASAGSDGEARLHRLADAEPARRLVDRRHLRLSRGGDIDEDGDEDQQRIAEQAEEAEAEGEGLADRGGDAGGARAAELHRQQRPQHPSAIHRKGGNEIEDGEKQVGVGEAGDERHLRIVEPLEVGGIELADEQQQNDCDDEIDRRPGDGDGEFLRRLLRQCLHAGDAADRQQRDFRRLNAVAARDENVAELVQHDADENEDDEDEAVARRRRPALPPGAEADPGEQQQEGDVNLHRRAAEAANRQGPAHRGRLARLRRGRSTPVAPMAAAARALSHIGRGGAAGAAASLRGRGKARENGDGLFVLDLAEVDVERADGAEARGRFEADEIVDFAFERRQRLGRGDRNGERQRFRAAAADRLQRGARGRAGGDAVVDENGGAAGDSRARPIADQPPPRAFELGQRADSAPSRTRARRSRRRG